MLVITAGAEAIKRADIDPKLIDGIVMGECFTAMEGSLAARQVSMRLGFSERSNACVVNQNCASGMRALDIQANSILLGKDPNMPDGPGLVHMTGRIALAYMRTRSTGSGGDFARTERQRKVVAQLFDKCRSLSLLELVGLYNEVSSGMKMSLSAMDILSVLSQGYALMSSGADFVEYRIPQDGTYSYGQVGSSSVLDVRWKTNRTRFHALLDNEP